MFLAEITADYMLAHEKRVGLCGKYIMDENSVKNESTENSSYFSADDIKEVTAAYTAVKSALKTKNLIC